MAWVNPIDCTQWHLEWLREQRVFFRVFLSSLKLTNEVRQAPTRATLPPIRQPSGYG
jgi:hypothetical protein